MMRKMLFVFSNKTSNSTKLLETKSIRQNMAYFVITNELSTGVLQQCLTDRMEYLWCDASLTIENKLFDTDTVLTQTTLNTNVFEQAL